MVDKKTNFLIGRAERLLVPVTVKKGFGEEKPVYSLPEAKRRLGDQIHLVSTEIASLEEDVCPNGIAVAKIQLNPSYIARSYFPEKLLKHINMRSVGSRNVVVKPEKWKRVIPTQPVETTELFVAGDKSAFAELAGKIQELGDETKEAIQFARIESLSTFFDGEKIIGQFDDVQGGDYFEVCLHLTEDTHTSSEILYAFEAYAEKIGVTIYDDFQFEAGNLWFVPVYADLERIAQLSKFSMVRLVRAMPKLRGIRPLARGANINLDCELPDQDALSDDVSVAILDGGIPDNHVVGRWLDGYVKLNPNADDDQEGNEHGLGVTSAFLFGPIEPGAQANRPYSPVTNIRLLDRETDNEDPLELYQTLGYIEEILESGQFEYINLSLGPDLPIEDNDVHAWTSVIDGHLSDGRTFMAIAAGNNGDLDQASGNARIQVPSDCINATAVGASDSNDSDWGRAYYSAIGPGRNPGLIKPDMLAFGGSPKEYFHVLSGSNNLQVIPNMGTSFASPYLLRKAVGIRATLGKEISPLVSKALLIHSCQPSKTDGVQCIGWGRIPKDLNDIITSPDGVARIVYQGELTPSKYVRAEIPLPDYVLKGKVTVKATLCYTCDTDPQDSGAYSKAGLEITFRPHKGKTKKNEKGDDIVKTNSFFSELDYETEADRRKHSQKWETTLHASKTMYGRSLERPIFEIHHIARDAAGEPRKPRRVRYALIISIESKHHVDLYNDILQNYSEILSPIEPRIDIPVQV